MLRTSPVEVSWALYETESGGEAPVLGLCREWSTPSLALLPGLFWPRGLYFFGSQSHGSVYLQIICIWLEYLISYNSELKTSETTQNYKYRHIQFPSLYVKNPRWFEKPLKSIIYEIFNIYWNFFSICCIENFHIILIFVFSLIYVL